MDFIHVGMRVPLRGFAPRKTDFFYLFATLRFPAKFQELPTRILKKCAGAKQNPALDVPLSPVSHEYQRSEHINYPKVSSETSLFKLRKITASLLSSYRPTGLSGFSAAHFKERWSL